MRRPLPVLARLRHADRRRQCLLIGADRSGRLTAKATRLTQLGNHARFDEQLGVTSQNKYCATIDACWSDRGNNF